MDTPLIMFFIGQNERTFARFANVDLAKSPSGQDRKKIVVGDEELGNGCAYEKRIWGLGIAITRMKSRNEEPGC